jgi:Fur family ferric uptake transcriptional regulator
MRLTRQRRTMLEALSRLETHPTAEEFYVVVRRRLPSISLGSVYRNLEVLAESGHILKLDMGGGPKRFDAKTKPHAHVRCPDCGALRDDWSAEVEGLRQELDRWLAAHGGFAGYRLEFTSQCPDCRQAGMQALSRGVTPGAGEAMAQG